MTTFAQHEYMATCQPAVAERLATVSQIPRPRDGGSFYQSQTNTINLPFDLAVTDWQDLKSSYSKDVGLTETSLVEVTDNDEGAVSRSLFIFRKIIPQYQQSAISVDMMPPLGTRVNGFNTYIARKLAQQGLHSRIVGTNQAKGHSMLHDTQANMAILRADDERNAGSVATCLPDTSLDLGYSMGQMKAFAKQSLAPAFGWNIVYNKGIDPCVARLTGYRELLTREMAAYFIADGAIVPRNMCRQARAEGLQTTIGRAKHWMGTVSVAPCFALNTQDKWRTILTGEAGTFLPNAPTDTPIVLHTFDGSKLNHRDIFESQLSAFSDVRLVHERGRHLSAASPIVVGNIVSDIVSALKLIENGSSKSDLVETTSRPLIARQ